VIKGSKAPVGGPHGGVLLLRAMLCFWAWARTAGTELGGVSVVAPGAASLKALAI